MVKIMVQEMDIFEMVEHPPHVSSMPVDSLKKVWD